MSEINEQDLNEVFEEELDDATVITVPIDDTLTQEGEAADAKAVGDALALKADAASITEIDVNGEGADAQGHILINATHIPVSDAAGADTIAEALERTGADIPLTGDAGSQTIAEAFAGIGAVSATTIPMSTDPEADTVAEAIEALQEGAEGCVKSVNGQSADSNGNVQLSEVPLAKNLTSSSAQSSAGAFVIRTTGGSKSVANGKAYLQEVRGAQVHTGYVAEVLEVTVDATSGITAALTHDTWVGAVSENGTYTFEYNGSAWKLDAATVTLADYGITVTGSPTNGDSITVDYVAEERGTITVATPSAIVSTGWNLFNVATGYARVAKYEHDYMIGGTYTQVQFSTTYGGARTTITVNEDGTFSINADGYVWVTGGDATTTYVCAVWTDWTTGPDVAFAAYTESQIDLSSVMDSYFPYGLMAVGTVYDEISISGGQAISRVERMAYSAENLAAVISAGRAYDVDEDYIYAVRTSAVTNSITISSEYTVSDHGMEWFNETEVGPYAIMLYGQDLNRKLTNEVVTYTEQVTTAAQKKQAQDNIGVTDLINSVTARFGNAYINTDAGIDTVGKLVNTIKNRATGSLGIVRISKEVVTSLAGSTTVTGIVFAYKASSSNIYYMCFSKTKAAIGNIAISNNAVTKTSLI